MANGPLSPVMLIASNGLMANPSSALIANTDLGNAIAEYQSQIQVAPVVAKALALGNVGNISSQTISDLITIGNTIVPPLGDAIIPSLEILANGINNTASFTQLVEDRANQILGQGDLSIFAQVYGMAYGYLKQTNVYIKSANNTEVVGATFTSMDALTTGGLSQVSSDVSSFGRDIAAIGTTIDLSRLQYLGHPWVLLRQMLQAGGLLPDVYNALILVGVTDKDILSVQNNKPEMSADLDLKIYQGFMMVTGQALAQVCELLDVTLPVSIPNTPTATSAPLKTAADLLNPKKILPNSWQSLIVQLPSGEPTPSVNIVTVNIYDTSSGQVSSQVSDFYKIDPAFLDLSKIIPADQAAANLAWSRSFYQIKNVINLTLPKLSASATAVEPNTNLTFIQSLNGETGPVPANVKSQLFSELGTGSGENGLLYLDDLLGVVGGSPWTNAIGNLNSEISNISNLSAFQNVTGTYTIMVNMLNGDYGNVSVGNIYLPGDATPYGNADAALQPLIANAVANISVFQATYPTQSSTLNDLWTVLTDQFTMECDNLNLAKVNFQELQTSRPAIMSLGTSLHSIGTDPDAAPFFGSIANVNDQGGQAVIASLREGRNIDVLGKSGVGTDTQLPAN